MGDIDRAALERALDLLPQRHKGPGGVAGVVKDGQVIARRAWGYADLATRQPMAASTRLPICSISKQFTCALLLDLIGDPARLDGKLAGLLPNFTGTLPTVRQLCDNQSGLRDYWALTVLHGATAEAEFRRSDAAPLIARMKTGHFAPGAAYSYCNANYRLLSELIVNETGRPLAELYAERLFGPAGMSTAILNADTRRPADGVVGYEGNDETGHLPAANGIWWEGDAGIAASLDDMLAWERWIDATRDDPAGLYNRLSQPPAYGDGTPANYGYGLRHDTVAGVRTTGHSGALRGFRAHRYHAASERLSVVVIFNHDGNTTAAAASLLEAALGWQPPEAPTPPPGWDGQWLDRENGLLVRIAADRTGLSLRYGTGPARLSITPDGSASGGGVHLRRDGDRLVMRREIENLHVTADPLPPVELADGSALAGRYWSDELEADAVIEVRDGAAFIGFEGMLGRGPMERMYPAGADVWLVSTRRSMDAPAPGDWTLQVRRDGTGQVSGLTLGCWLARNIPYRKL